MKKLILALMAATISTSAFAHHQCGIFTDGENFVQIKKDPWTYNGRPCTKAVTDKGYPQLNCNMGYGALATVEIEIIKSGIDEGGYIHVKGHLGLDGHYREHSARIEPYCLPLKLEKDRSCILDGEQAFFEKGTPVCE